jgi:hypothetical protein
MRTKMLHELAVVATLPEYAACLVTYHLPGAEIDGPLVGRVLEEGSAGCRQGQWVR